MNKLNVGDYVRTKDGRIEKYSGSNNAEIENFTVPEIIKSSPNIIDLIEVGDYVNGYLVKNCRASCNENLGGHPKQIDVGQNKENKWLRKEDIKSIVTKEQFENISYKVGE